MPKVSRRSLIATTAAALTAFAVPAAAAEAEDPEPLALGVEFDKVAVDWVRQRRSDRARRREFHARLAAAGLRQDQYPDHPSFFGLPEPVAATKYRSRQAPAGASRRRTRTPPR